MEGLGERQEGKSTTGSVHCREDDDGVLTWTREVHLPCRCENVIAVFLCFSFFLYVSPSLFLSISVCFSFFVCLYFCFFLSFLSFLLCLSVSFYIKGFPYVVYVRTVFVGDEYNDEVQ